MGILETKRERVGVALEGRILGDERPQAVPPYGQPGEHVLPHAEPLDEVSGNDDPPEAALSLHNSEDEEGDPEWSEHRHEARIAPQRKPSGNA